MIEVRKGNILGAGTEALVNSVNCVGVMGRGIALQFKEAFPANFRAYKAACARNDVEPGRMFVFETGAMTNPRYIINFPTKRHWRGKSRMEDIEAGLAALLEEIRNRDIKSIAIPPLGAGLGGLQWLDVRPRIEAALASVSDLDVVLFEPSNVEATTSSRDVPKMTPGRAALVGLIDRYLSALLDPFVTLLEVHKLMYFMQEAGEPLKLRYTKAPYGPYAENFRHVLRAIDGHLISGYADVGDAPNKQLTLLPGAVKDAEAYLADDMQTRERLSRVSKLVEGFETPFGLELLATVHWVVKQEGAESVEDTVLKTYAWNEQKKSFTVRQIRLAFDALATKAWL